MDGLDITLLIIAAALIPIGGLCAAGDAAFGMVSAARAEEMEREGRRGASSLLAIARDKPRYTNLLVLLRVACELSATVMVAAVALSTWGFHWWVAGLTIAIMLVICYVVIGVGPRTLGRQHPYSVGLRAAPLTRLVGRVLSPVASLLILIGNALTPGKGFRDGPFSSDIELREMLDRAGDAGVVQDEEREMLQSVFDLGDTIAREVMVPRTEMVWIEQTKSVRQALALATRSGLSRLPVIGEDTDDIVGVVHVRDLIAVWMALPDGAEPPALTTVMRPPSFVPEFKSVDDLLRQMQVQRTHFAIVVDEYGGTAGLVTIEDILEEIVGEITDEHDLDTSEPIEDLGDEVVRVSAKLPVEDLGAVFDVELPTDDVETVGGLFAQILGRVPLAGSEATVNGLHLLGEAGVDRRGKPRVRTLIVRRLTEAEQDDLDRVEQQRQDADRADRERGEADRSGEREHHDSPASPAGHLEGAVDDTTVRAGHDG